jgi:crossover junction endodeoxyribonuclease RusA
VTLTICVHGTPAPQGSKTRTRYGLRDDNADRLKPWRQSVTWAARDAMTATGWQTATGPLHVDLTLVFARPKGHHGTGRNADRVRPSAPVWPATKPDIDKCARAILDGLTDAGVWRDDAQVVTLTAGKSYCLPGGVPGAVVVVRRVAERAVGGAA